MAKTPSDIVDKILYKGKYKHYGGYGKKNKGKEEEYELEKETESKDYKW